MTDRFLTNDGIVSDVKTGLLWEDGHHGPMTWGLAMEYAKSLRLGGHADWRVPTIEELVTLIDFSRHSPASAFPGMPSEYFWSSSSYSGSSSLAWAVSFNLGSVSCVVKTYSLSVRCVRRGPVCPSGLRPLDQAEELDSLRVDMSELEKMKKMREQLGTQHIGVFLDWLGSEGIILARWGEGEHPQPHYESIEQLLARYAGIDLKAVEREKQELLDQILGASAGRPRAI